MVILLEGTEKECFKVRYPALHMKMCKTARPSQQQLSFCYGFTGDCPPKAYSTEFFRVVIRGYVRLCVCLSVSPSLNLYNREWTYFNETHHNSLLTGPHDIFKVNAVKGRRQRRPGNLVNSMDSEPLKRFQPKLTQILHAFRRRTD